LYPPTDEITKIVSKLQWACVLRGQQSKNPERILSAFKSSKGSGTQYQNPGCGVGRFSESESASSWRGAIYYQTSSQKLACLNTVAAIFEHAVDGEGNVHNLVWEQILIIGES
jgi:hypothetical protein